MLHLKLVTLSGTKVEKDIYEAILPTLDGQIGVMPGHMPLITVASNGVIAIRDNQKDPDSSMQYYATYGGVIEVDNDNLTILVDEADHENEINEAEAQKALELAQRMRNEAKNQVSLEHAQALVDRSNVRLRVAGLRRRHVKR